MPDGQRSRRRRGRRGGGNRPQEQPDGAPQQQTEPQSDGADRPDRPARRDNRRSVRGDAPPGPPPGPSSVRRAPQPNASRTDGRDRRDDRPRRPDDRPRRPGDERPRRNDDRRPRDGGRRDGQRRDDDRSPRSFEPPVPQDPLSIELGAAFKESQVAVRDARKALDKRKAESGDEPDWLLEQLAAAEARLAEASTAWVQHLETTGRKVVRSR